VNTFVTVTASRLHAVRYKQAFDKYTAEKGYHCTKLADGI
jgi:hypothetical protein